MTTTRGILSSILLRHSSHPHRHHPAVSPVGLSRSPNRRKNTSGNGDDDVEPFIATYELPAVDESPQAAARTRPQRVAGLGHQWFQFSYRAPIASSFMIFIFCFTTNAPTHHVPFSLVYSAAAPLTRRNAVDVSPGANARLFEFEFDLLKALSSFQQLIIIIVNQCPQLLVKPPASDTFREENARSPLIFGTPGGFDDDEDEADHHVLAISTFVPNDDKINKLE